MKNHFLDDASQYGCFSIVAKDKEQAFLFEIEIHTPTSKRHKDSLILELGLLKSKQLKIEREKLFQSNEVNIHAEEKRLHEMKERILLKRKNVEDNLHDDEVKKLRLIVASHKSSASLPSTTLWEKYHEDFYKNLARKTEQGAPWGKLADILRVRAAGLKEETFKILNGLVDEADLKRKDTDASFEGTSLAKKVLSGQTVLASPPHGSYEKGKNAIKAKLKLNVADNRKLDEANKAVEAINDSVRYEVVAPSGKLVESYEEVKKAYSKAGFEVVKIRNHFIDDHDPFNALNVVFMRPAVIAKQEQSDNEYSLEELNNGLPFEVQFHTLESKKLKDEYHTFYKINQNAKSRLRQIEEEDELGVTAPSSDIKRMIAKSQNVLQSTNKKLSEQATIAKTKHFKSIKNIETINDLSTNELTEQAARIISERFLTNLELEKTNKKKGWTPGEAEYSVYKAITGNDTVEFEVPGGGMPLSYALLNRLPSVDGVRYRVDATGGSRLKSGTSLSSLDILRGQSRGKNHLFGIPAVDSLSGSSFTKLLMKLAPLREDYSRLQRALTERVPVECAMEGTLKIGALIDASTDKALGAKALNQHKFKPTYRAADGQTHEIHICSDDGCGFMRFEVAMRIPAFREQVATWAGKHPERLLADEVMFKQIEGFLEAIDKPKEETDMTLETGESQHVTLIPSQALQHFPRNEVVSKQFKADLDRELKIRQRNHVKSVIAKGENLKDNPFKLSKIDLYSMSLSGAQRGRRFRAIPSADNTFYFCDNKIDDHAKRGGATLAGHPPYDAPTLLPIPKGRLEANKNENKTCEFLSRCFILQYSLTGFDESSEEATENNDMLHAKGQLIVPLPMYWPEDPAFRDLDMIVSQEDVKTHSTWTKKRERNKLPEDLKVQSFFKMKEFTPPGNAVAVPIHELRLRAMDTDGDEMFLYPASNEISEILLRERAKFEVVMGDDKIGKLPKTATPALDKDGNYQFGRAEEILRLQTGGALMPEASQATYNFLAQPYEKRKEIADKSIFGTYEGIDSRLRKQTRRLLDRYEDPRNADWNELKSYAQDMNTEGNSSQTREVYNVLMHELDNFKTYIEKASKDGDEIDLTEVKDDSVALPLSDSLSNEFKYLAEGYKSANSAEARLRALIDRYPVCRLPSHEFMKDQHGNVIQTGRVPEDNVASIRNLVALSLKSGTDAEKTNSKPHMFYSALSSCFNEHYRYTSDKVNIVPYRKEFARKIYEERLFPSSDLEYLERNPTMAAGVMAECLQLLVEKGLLKDAETKAQRAQRRIERTPLRFDEMATFLFTAAKKHQPKAHSIVAEAIKNSTLTLDESDNLKSKAGVSELLLHKFGKQEFLTIRSSLAKTKNLIRFNLISSNTGFKKNFFEVVGNLVDNNVLIESRHNSFSEKQEDFAAITVKAYMLESNFPFEIQFHTEDSFELKQKHQTLFHEIMSHDFKGIKTSERKKLLAAARDDYKNLMYPDKINNIENQSSIGLRMDVTNVFPPDVLELVAASEESINEKE